MPFLTDFLENGRFDIGKELSNKLSVIRFIVGLLEHRDDVAISSSQESSSDEEECYEQSKRLLKPDCLKFFDKVAAIYPFSDVEKSHMRNTLKLQVILDLITTDHFQTKCFETLGCCVGLKRHKIRTKCLQFIRKFKAF